MSDVIDSRNLLEELKTLDKIDDLDRIAEIEELIEEVDRIAEIEELIEEVGRDYCEDGITFISERYWVQYCEDTAYEYGYLDGNPNDYNPLSNYIDWQGWADAVAMDYNQTEFNGDTYYWRV